MAKNETLFPNGIVACTSYATREKRPLTDEEDKLYGEFELTDSFLPYITNNNNTHSNKNNNNDIR